MITARPTKNPAGITLEGTYEVLSEIVESIYRMTDDNMSDPYKWHGIIASKRKL